MGRFQTQLAVGREMLAGWRRHRINAMAAALAFYTTLSLAPMMVLTMAVIGTFASREATRDALLAGVGDALGTEGAAMVENVVHNWSMPRATWWMPVVGVVVLLWASTSAFNQLRLALNRILDVSARSRKRMAHALWNRWLALCLVGIIVLLLAASMALSSAVTLLDETLTPNFPGFHGWLERVGPAGSWLMSCLLFYVIYRMLPDRTLPWRLLVTSSLVAASLFAASKFGLDYYLGRGHGVASMYGAAGSMVVIQIWIFVANLILLGGAEWMHAMLDAKSGHGGHDGDGAESEAGGTRDE